MTTPGQFRSREGGGGTVLVLNRAAIEAFNLPGGQTFRWARSIAREISEGAKANLTYGHGLRTGKLQRSIDFSATPTGGGVVANVRATANYALYVHEGTPRHTNRKQSGRYKFVGYGYKHAGRTVLVHDVTIPARRANPFIRNSMRTVLAAHGITR